jgi:UDP-glucose:(heptosyl)LPS alpha-1,3-glucosyltransferase
MKLAFCLFKYYPFGGLERDFLRTVQLCLARGYEVHVFTMRWQGKIPPHCKVTFIPVSAWTNHGRVQQFADKLTHFLQQEHFDVVIGFNRIPGLDVYLQADLCYRSQIAKKHGAWYRLLPRYHIYADLEETVFSPKSHTKILLLNPHEKAEFMRYYQTPSVRFHDVPPGIGADRARPANQAEVRDQFRNEMQIKADNFVILMVGSDFQRKGVDRTLRALAELPEKWRDQTKLWIVGNGDNRSMQKLATTLGVRDCITFFGAREDVVRFYAAADLLLHPAYQENTGTILIEALVAGLPIMVTEICGYSSYVTQAMAGVVLHEPFHQLQMSQQLALMLNQESLKHYRENALQFAAQHDLFHLTDFVVGVIENAAKK